jgi:hypothetical protein
VLINVDRYKEGKDDNMYDKHGVDEDVSLARPVDTLQVRALPPETHRARASRGFIIAAIPSYH